MRRVKGKVEKIRGVEWRVLDELNGVFGQEVSGVAFFAKGGVVLMPIELAFAFVSEIVDSSIVVSYEVGEAVSERELGFAGVTKVPFSNDASSFVTGGGEEFGKGVFFIWKSIGRPGGDDRAHQTEANGPAPGEKSGASGRAHRAGAKVGELDPAFYKAIEIGGDCGFAAIESGVGIAKVIGDDDDDVGLGQGLCEACEEN